MSALASSWVDANVHDLHKVICCASKKYLCFTKANSKLWTILVSDGIDVWLQELDEDNLEALRDLSGINTIEAYLAKFRNGFSNGDLSVTRMGSKVKFTVGSGGSAIEFDLFEAKSAGKKNELQSILFKLAESCVVLEEGLASYKKQVETLRAQKSAGGGGLSALLNLGHKKAPQQNKSKQVKAGMSVINPTSRKRKAAAGVIFGEDD